MYPTARSFCTGDLIHIDRKSRCTSDYSPLRDPYVEAIFFIFFDVVIMLAEQILHFATHSQTQKKRHGMALFLYLT